MFHRFTVFHKAVQCPGIDQRFNNRRCDAAGADPCHKVEIIIKRPLFTLFQNDVCRMFADVFDGRKRQPDPVFFFSSHTLGQRDIRSVDTNISSSALIDILADPTAVS